MAKLRGLVGSVDAELGFLDGEDPGAARTTDGAAWCLVTDPSIQSACRGLGRMAVLDADRRHIVVDLDDVHARIVADLADCFKNAPSVWAVRGAKLHLVVVATALGESKVGREPRVRSSLIERSVLADEHVALLDVIADRVPLLAAEREADGVALLVRGLEVARLVADERGTVLELGVGRVDREARFELEGVRIVDRDSIEHHVRAIESVVVEVDQRRRAEASPHPARTLRRERWMRQRIIEDPGLAELDPGTRLEPLMSLRAPANLDDWSIAAARSLGDDGTVVVCAVGPDLALAAAAAEVWFACATDGRSGPLVVVVPGRDILAATTRSLEALRPELAVRLVAIRDDWAG